MATTRRQVSSGTISSTIDGGLRVGSGAVNATVASVTCGRVLGTNQHHISVFPIPNLLGKVSSISAGFTISASTLSSGSGDLWVFNVIELQQERIIEAEYSHLVVRSGENWVTGPSGTSGPGTSFGCNTNSAIRQVVTPPFSGETFPQTLVQNTATLINASMVDQMKRGVASSNLVFAIIQGLESSGTGSNRNVNIRNHEDVSAPPVVSFNVSLEPYGHLMNDDEVVVSKSAEIFRVRVKIGTYENFVSGDTLAIEWGTASNLSGATTTQVIDLTGKSANSLVDFHIRHNSPATTIYWRVKFVIAGVTIQGEILNEAMPASSSILTTGLWGEPRGNRKTATTAQVISVLDVAFQVGDKSFIEYGAIEGAPDHISEYVDLPTAVPNTCNATLTDLNITERCYYRLVHRVGGVDYVKEDDYQISQVVAGTHLFVYSADLHGMSVEAEESGQYPLGNIGVYAPQNQRALIRDRFVELMLLQKAEDGGYAHGRIELGDWIQTHLTGNHAYPVSTVGLPFNVTGTTVTSLNDARYHAMRMTSKDRSLARIPLIAHAVGNHDSGFASCFGSSWDGISKPLVVGRNTISPERDCAGWTLQAKKEITGLPDGTGVYGGGDPYGRWYFIDYPNVRIIVLDSLSQGPDQSTIDPNTLPVTWETINHPTIGAQYDFLFNASTGCYRTCTKRNIHVVLHCFSATRQAGGPGRYCWSGWKVASPRGSEPHGEWPGVFETDPHGYNNFADGTWQKELRRLGVHKSFVKYEPENSITVFLTGHSHVPLIEIPHDGLQHIAVGRMAAGSDDTNTVIFGQGHYGQLTGSGYDPADEMFRTGNTALLTEKCSPLQIIFSLIKVWYNFEGLFTALEGDPVSVQSYEPGFLQNSSRNPVWKNNTEVFKYTLSHWDHPIESWKDSFNRVVEDSTVYVAEGNIQVENPEGQVCRCRTERGAYWKNFGDGHGRMCVRISPIDGLKVLATRPPIDIDGAELQGIRRAISSLNRHVGVSFRTETANLAMIQIAGKDVVTTRDTGLYLALTFSGLELNFADDTNSLLSTVVCTWTTTFKRILVTMQDKVVRIVVEDEILEEFTLTDNQWNWLSENGSYVGLIGQHSNSIGEGGHEWRDFSAGPCKSVKRTKQLQHV